MFHFRKALRLESQTIGKPKPVILSATAALFGLSITACSSTPPDEYTQDARNRAQWHSIEETDSAEMKKLNYLARYLATGETRREITAEVYNVDFIERWSASNYGTAAAMATDLFTGQLVSNLSGSMDLAVSGIVGVYRMFNNGSYSHVSQVWLPETYNDIELVDQTSARQAMLQFTEDRLTVIADKYGYSYECMLGCNDYETPRSYLFQRDQSQVRDYHFTYQPDEFGFFVNLLPPVEVTETDILPLLIGEGLKWKTPEYNSAPHFFMADFNRDEENQITTVFTKDDIELLSANRYMFETEMGRHLLRDFHSTPYSMYGNDTLYPKMFFHNNGVYRYLLKSRKEFLQWKIDMTPTALPSSSVAG